MNPAVLLYPIPSVLDQAASIRARLAGASVKLFKTGLNPTFSTTLAEVLAAECDFSGYPAGGTVTPTWLPAVLAPGQGAAVSSPVVQFVVSGGGPVVGNLAGGFAVVTADNVLFVVGSFPEAFPFQVAGQGMPLQITVGVGS